MLGFDAVKEYLRIKNSWLELTNTLAIGLVGGVLFSYLQLPLPWILGALFTTTFSAMLGQRLWIPNWLRMTGLLILGALFGTSVSPQFMDSIYEWLLSMIAVLIFIVLAIPPVMLYLIKIAKLDPITAYFSAAPGGLLPMTFVGQEMGADAKTISLIHSSRIILTVLIIPVSYTLFFDYEPTGKMGNTGSFSELKMPNGLFLLLVSIAGYLIARPLKIPTPALLGPMIAVAAFSLNGIIFPKLPESLIAIAQGIIGCSIGAMFSGIEPKLVARIVFHGSITSIFTIIFAVTCAVVTSYVSLIPTHTLILAFAPGGFAEMALVGFALGIDIAFVVTHQLTRYFFIILAIPVIFRIFKNINRS
jgi:membrane AbrB-like protein